MRFKFVFAVAASCICCGATAQNLLLPKQTDRWSILSDGSIAWQIKDRLPHSDHIEMSGEKVSLWVAYGVDDKGVFSASRTVVFPTFRTLPNNTRSHIAYTFVDNELPRIYINNRQMALNTIRITQHGIMRVEAQMGKPVVANVERSFYPSVDKPMAFEKFVITNNGKTPVPVVMEHLRREVTTDTATSKGHAHTVIMQSVNDGRRLLQPGQSTTFAVCYRATDEPTAPFAISSLAEETARKNRVAEIQSPLKLETPDTILNTAFAFAKLRANESIFKTKGGYIHSPGGVTYYAAIWANDQAEYVSPYFAFTGDRLGNLSAMTCYHWFAKYMNPDFKTIPSSIVAEGDTTWNGAGDRGDQAMIAYGASRYALTYGNADTARKLWPLITWCLEYSKRHINAQGVVESKSDELEGRFPSGKANLSTNSLYYDALISTAYLARSLDQPKTVANDYLKQAAQLRSSMEKYFGANVEGFDTYKYYETNTTLRAWICLPLTMGIFDRAKGTVAALFSPRLWTADGLATEAGKETFWDRSTLYALRGVLQAGETEKAMDFLKYYSRRRLLGEHVPYPVEAWPEGNQRHLSAESGLYCRIYIEGLFGIRATALNGFDCSPRLPKGWDKMALRNIHAFGKVFDVEVVRKDASSSQVIVKQGANKKAYVVKNGATVGIKL